MATPHDPYGAPAGDPWAGQQTTGPQGGGPVYPGGTPGYPQPGYPQPGYAQPGYAQPGYAQPGYGMPAYPGGPMGGYRPDPGPPPARPGSGVGACWLWMAAAGASLSSVVLLFTSGTFNQALALAAGGTDSNGVSVQTLVSVAKTVAVVTMVILVGSVLFFVMQLLLASHWARVVLTVVAGLSIVGSFSERAQVTVDGTVYSVGSSQTLRWVQAGLAVLALVLMYLPASNGYFTAMKARRMYRR